MVLRAAAEQLPDTLIHILTNGRSFSDAAFASTFRQHAGRVVWAVPIYSDTAGEHDYIVQARGAFDEAISGIYNLAEAGHRIEIRCVVTRQNSDRLGALAEFLYRNIPFAEHVALMGLEPMGYARLNRELLWIDPLDSAPALAATVRYLADRDMRVSLYNFPLCVLDQNLWPYAKKSISDWKNMFPPVCENCDLKSQCGGFFQSADANWISRGVHPIRLDSQMQ
jgi:His-Xaa-Ser system radical SAM maturase HxsC